MCNLRKCGSAASNNDWEVQDYLYHINSNGLICKMHLPQTLKVNSPVSIPESKDKNLASKNANKLYEASEYCVVSSSSVIDEHDIRDLLLIRLFPLKCADQIDKGNVV